ncbi:MAG TPA: ABC transporter permease [Acidobacteriota bacterium]|nr:ABC transporter permease [Acidobacteriota bacterium]
MLTLLRIAWRNLWRNTRRTLLTALTVALGLALLLVSLGLGDGAHQQMIESAVRMGSGHVLVQADGYQAIGGIERTLREAEADEARRRIEAAGDFPVTAVTTRIFASGLASSADGSTGVQIIGVEPGGERAGSNFPKKIIEGQFLDEGDDNLVVIGRGVARKLELEVGDKLVLMAQAADTSEVQSRLVRVKGILGTGQDQYDQIIVLLPLSEAQRFFNLPGQVHQLAVILESSHTSEELARALRQSLASDRQAAEQPSAGSPPTTASAATQEQLDAEGFRRGGVEVLNWRQALPELEEFIRVDDGGNYVFHVFLFLLIGFMVLNTLLMSVLERRREFTLLSALGLPPAQRFTMVLLEAALIGALASAAGLALGWSAHKYFEVYGLPLAALMDIEEGATVAGVAFDPVMYSYLSPERIFLSILWIFVMTLILAVMPAWRAARAADVQLLGRD